MDRLERLRQLREQHRLVSGHLAWLEAQIAAEERAAASHPPFPAGPAVPEPIVSRLSPADTSAPAETPHSVDVGPDFVPAEGLGPTQFTSHRSAADEARRQKFGCVLITVLATAIAVFLIWGLPLILYPD